MPPPAPTPSPTPEQSAADAAAFAAALGTAIASTAPARVLTLDNGLSVLLRPDPAHPVVAVQMYYKVGARHETIGITGIAHYLEHMLFRGTDHFGPDDITGVIERAGGEWHGYTWLDGTTYFEAAPKALLGTLLRLEADRMTLARMASNEVEPERGAVFQEYRGYQLNPRSDLFDAVMAMLFLQHPYRNNTMGWESDLAGITHADLVAFYKRWYGPRNAVLAIAGDFELDAAEREVRKVFGDIPARGDDVATRTIEPPVEGTRRVRLLRDGASPALLMSFQAPPATRPREYAALMVLDALLGSARGLSFQHHSGDQTEGLEVDALGRFFPVVQFGPAASLGTAFVPMVYPGHYSIYATPKPGRTLADLEAAINRVLLGAANNLTSEQVAEARRLILAADSVETDSPLEAAHEMAYWTALGGPEARRAVLEALAGITPEEVRDLARSLTPEHAAIGWLLPAGGSPMPAPSDVPGRPAGASLPPGRPECPSTSKPGDLQQATVATVTAGRFEDTATLIDVRPGLPTFALRVAVAPPHDMRGAARSLADDSTAGRQAAACGIAFNVTAPGEGRFDERDAMQVEMSGPAASLMPALTILERALRASLAAPSAEPGKVTRPDELAIVELEKAMDRGLVMQRPVTPPVPQPIIANPTGSGAVGPAPYPHLVITLVSPYDDSPELARRRSGIAGIVGETFGSRRSHPPPRPSPAALAAAPAAPPAPLRAPFAPGEITTTLPAIVQGRLLIALPGDPDPVVQEAVAWILHHNYGGRLGTEAIAKTGLVYEMDSESSRRGAPLVWFSMGADPLRLPALQRILNAVLDTAWRDAFFTNAEVDAYRSYAAGRAAVRLAHPDQAARYWTSLLLRGGDGSSPARAAARAEALSGDEVRAAARRMLEPSRRLNIFVGKRSTD